MSRSGFIPAVSAKRAVGEPSAVRRSQAGHRARGRDQEQRLAALQKDYADLYAALFEAAQVHRRLCAPSLLRYGSFHIASDIFAVRQLPGDFFLAQEKPSGVMLALGDVCGKGLSAGMWVTHLAGLVSTHGIAHSEPQAIVAGVNRDFCRMSGVPLVSLFLARLDPVSGTLDYCSAGHPPTLLLRAEGELESLSEGGPLLGVMANASFVQGRTHLRPGDVLVAYSDGILDSVNPAGENFGYERLKMQLRPVDKSSAETVLFSLLGAVQDFAGGCPLEDDLSLVVVRRNNDPGQ